MQTYKVLYRNHPKGSETVTADQLIRPSSKSDYVFKLEGEVVAVFSKEVVASVLKIE